MKLYRFTFGFCSPAQWKANEENDWDDEDSWAIYIRDSTKERAMEWGRHLAEVFVQGLFEWEKWPGPIPSWKDSQFAHWVDEMNDSENVDPRCGEFWPVEYGEEPDYCKWVEMYFQPVRSD